MILQTKTILTRLMLPALLTSTLLMGLSLNAYATVAVPAGGGGGGTTTTTSPSTTTPSQSYSLGDAPTSSSCGGPGDTIKISFDIGCSHKGNAILDATFAFIRFLSDGAGLVIVGSLVWAGIQYTTSRGDPQATAAAVSRIENVMIALLVFVFAYAILNYLIPGQVLK